MKTNHHRRQHYLRYHQRQYHQKRKPAVKREAPSLRTANKLFNAYEENEVAMDEQMKEKLIAVTGIVQSIDKDFTGSVVIHLKTNNQFMPGKLLSFSLSGL
ncbi:OB-fold putative lipoprotein [Serratia fonticola]|uniref:OB-fold putative lipoprotein n=1 Tax=Serratia fonticola TaxID=47917 RepID=UPI0021BD139B|nr:OB-fold putative lipoprotein [Serratia fonticola]